MKMENVIMLPKIRKIGKKIIEKTHLRKNGGFSVNTCSNNLVNQFVNDFVAKRGIITSITVVHFRVSGAFSAISVSAGC